MDSGGDMVCHGGCYGGWKRGWRDDSRHDNMIEMTFYPIRIPNYHPIIHILHRNDFRVFMNRRVFQSCFYCLYVCFPVALQLHPSPVQLPVSVLRN